jgi:hypothetical protein
MDDMSPAHETSDAMWDRLMAINVTGPFKLMRAVLRRCCGVATGIPVPELSTLGSGRLRPLQAVMPGVATAEQLAASITFLLSDDSTNLNGVVAAIRRRMVCTVIGRVRLHGRSGSPVYRRCPRNASDHHRDPRSAW